MQFCCELRVLHRSEQSNAGLNEQPDSGGTLGPHPPVSSGEGPRRKHKFCDKRWPHLSAKGGNQKRRNHYVASIAKPANSTHLGGSEAAHRALAQRKIPPNIEVWPGRFSQGKEPTEPFFVDLTGCRGIGQIVELCCSIVRPVVRPVPTCLYALDGEMVFTLDQLSFSSTYLLLPLGFDFRQEFLPRCLDPTLRRGGSSEALQHKRKAVVGRRYPALLSPRSFGITEDTNREKERAAEAGTYLSEHWKALIFPSNLAKKNFHKKQLYACNHVERGGRGVILAEGNEVEDATIENTVSEVPEVLTWAGQWEALFNKTGGVKQKGGGGQFVRAQTPQTSASSASWRGSTPFTLQVSSTLPSEEGNSRYSILGDAPSLCQPSRIPHAPRTPSPAMPFEVDVDLKDDDLVNVSKRDIFHPVASSANMNNVRALGISRYRYRTIPSSEVDIEDWEPGDTVVTVAKTERHEVSQWMIQYIAPPLLHIRKILWGWELPLYRQATNCPLKGMDCVTMLTDTCTSIPFAVDGLFLVKNPAPCLWWVGQGGQFSSINSKYHPGMCVACEGSRCETRTATPEEAGSMFEASTLQREGLSAESFRYLLPLKNLDSDDEGEKEDIPKEKKTVRFTTAAPRFIFFTKQLFENEDPEMSDCSDDEDEDEDDEY